MLLFSYVSNCLESARTYFPNVSILDSVPPSYLGVELKYRHS